MLRTPRSSSGIFGFVLHHHHHHRHHRHSTTVATTTTAASATLSSASSIRASFAAAQTPVAITASTHRSTAPRFPLQRVSRAANRTMASSTHSLYTAETPEEIKNATGLHLITMSTPNGQKVQIFLEELAEVYGTKWGTTKVNIMTNEQKKEWFLRLNPNGRIPVLIDNNKSPPFPVMETSAELLYLQAHYDPDNHFGFADPHEQSQMMQWLIFWHGSGAPYQGQTNHFAKYAKEKIPYAITRFHNETLRVYEVLEIHLSGRYTGVPREYLAGNGAGRYSAADIGTWPWVSGWEYSGFTADEMAPFSHLRAWIERVGARAAVKRGTGEKYRL